jgi:hypothetical protein
MFRYLRLAALFLILQGCILLALLLGFDVGSHTYIAALADKSRLLATTPSPRIVLVGASSLAFSIDSALLEAGVQSRYHPVNMGLHGGLGLRFELNQAVRGVRTGDIVVLSLEYETLWADTIEIPTICSALLRQPGAWAYVPRDQRLWLLWHAFRQDEPLVIAHDTTVLAYGRLRATLSGVLGRDTIPENPLAPAEQSVYARAAFNQYGDNTAAWGAASRYAAESHDYGTPLEIDWVQVDKAVKALSDFIAECDRQGILVVYSYPPVPIDRYRWLQASIERTSRILESRLPISFLNDPTDEALAPESFFDGPLHLGGTAVQGRTRRLLEALLPYLETVD